MWINLIQTYTDALRGMVLLERSDIPAVPRPTSSFEMAAPLIEETRMVVRKAKNLSAPEANGVLHLSLPLHTSFFRLSSTQRASAFQRRTSAVGLTFLRSRPLWMIQLLTNRKKVMQKTLDYAGSWITCSVGAGCRSNPQNPEVSLSL